MKVATRGTGTQGFTQVIDVKAEEAWDKKELTKMKYAWRSCLGTSDTATQVKNRIREDGRTNVIWNNMDNILWAKDLGWEQGLGERTGEDTHQNEAKGMKLYEPQ